MHEGGKGSIPGQPLARDQWHPFLERMTRAIQGFQAAVEVDSLDYGHQRLAENVALSGLSFDPRDSLLEIALEGLGHRIDHPRSLTVDTLPNGVTALQIVGDDGTKTIVRLKQPLLLPEPASSS